MSNLIPFAFEQHRVRIITRDGAQWFILTDLCEVLEIANVGNAAARLKDSEKDAVRVADAIGRGQQTVIVNESGFYRLVLRSDKPQAEKFQSWVTGEVLPSIRKTGTYRAPVVDFNDPAFLRQTLLGYTERVIALEAQRDALLPQAEALERIADAQGSFTITAAAKALQTARDALLSYMRSHGWIYRGGDGFLGYQVKINAGLLLHKVQSLRRENGPDRVVEQVRVTAKGLTRLAAAMGQTVGAAR